MDVESIETYSYLLQPISAPNRLSTAQMRKGVLLRVKFKGLDHFGFSDLFPWPELGDEPIDFQIESLKNGTPCRLAATSIQWAHYEAQAKEKSIFLLRGPEISSHETVIHIDQMDSSHLVSKIKISQEIINNWPDFQSKLEKFNKKYRFDFNGLFQTIDEAQSFWNGVSDNLKEKIEFLEDPYCTDLMSDKKAVEIFSPVPTAVDRSPTSSSLKINPIWVVKPIYYSPIYLLHAVSEFNGEIVTTSNMDHPLGQLIALHASQRIKSLYPLKIRLSGLLTHGLYEPHLQSSWIQTDENILHSQYDGIGWGLDLEFEKLTWVKLC
jgi:o-succinylbenzoate synthase